jgi:NAD(P)-dependent dehydrogenase (short-subunit alcohol dehydrogenase family)
MKTVLIIGASRGLGLEFVQQYLADGWKVIATVRRKVDVPKLEKLGATAIALDVTQPVAWAPLKRKLARQPIDVAIYNAGRLGQRVGGVTAVDKNEFNTVMQTNVFGAMHAITAVAPLLARNKGRFAFLSSRMGSMGAMASASNPLYRASKSGLNAVVKAASIEWGPQGVSLFVFHPGWVKTDMGGSEADIDAHVSIAGMRRVLAKAGDSNGKFINYDGTEIPW